MTDESIAIKIEAAQQILNAVRDRINELQFEIDLARLDLKLGKIPDNGKKEK